MQRTATKILTAFLLWVPAFPAIATQTLPPEGTVTYRVEKKLLTAHPQYGKKFGPKDTSKTHNLWENLDYAGTWTLSWDGPSIYQRLEFPEAKRSFEFLYESGISYSRTASMPYGVRRPGFVAEFIVPNLLPYNFPEVEIFKQIDKVGAVMQVQTLDNGDPFYGKVEMNRTSKGRTLELRVADYKGQTTLTAIYIYNGGLILHGVQLPREITLTNWRRPNGVGAISNVKTQPVEEFRATLLSVSPVTELPVGPEALYEIGDTLGYYNADASGVGIDFRPGKTIDEQAKAAFKIQEAADQINRGNTRVVYGPSSSQRVPTAAAGAGLVLVALLSVGFLLKSRAWG